jgi:hypothetical protein
LTGLARYRLPALYRTFQTEGKERNLPRIFLLGFTCWKKDGSNDSFSYSVLACFPSPPSEGSWRGPAVCGSALQQRSKIAVVAMWNIPAPHSARNLSVRVSKRWALPTFRWSVLLSSG